MITVAHIFYNQHAMLPLHREARNDAPRNSAEYVFVDDCSPIPLKPRSDSGIERVFRIVDNIPWNIAGARNLAFSVARCKWVLCADMDHVVSALALRQILTLDLTSANVVYTFSRKRPDGAVGCHAIVNFLMSKRFYFCVGGHDEDFSGNYGREETFFAKRLAYCGAKVVYRPEISLDWYPQLGSARGLVRDKTINSRIFDSKMDELALDRYRSPNILRFDWKRSIEGQ